LGLQIVMECTQTLQLIFKIPLSKFHIKGIAFDPVRYVVFADQSISLTTNPFRHTCCE
jgi:hypothetical protein